MLLPVPMFFAHLEAALVEAADFRAATPTVMDIYVAGDPWIVRFTSDGVTSCQPGTWPGGAAPVIRVDTMAAWGAMVDTPETLPALVAAGQVTMDEGADPEFWFGRWGMMLALRLDWTAAHP